MFPPHQVMTEPSPPDADRPFFMIELPEIVHILPELSMIRSAGGKRVPSGEAVDVEGTGVGVGVGAGGGGGGVTGGGGGGVGLGVGFGTATGTVPVIPP